MSNILLKMCIGKQVMLNITKKNCNTFDTECEHDNVGKFEETINESYYTQRHSNV